MDVAIVGGGPVGLMLACELGAYGVDVALFEQRSGTSRHPKANTHSARSMEFYRRHGISDQLRQRGMPADYPTDAAYFTRLNGHEIARVRLPSKAEALDNAFLGDGVWPTPEPQLRVSQLALEPLLRERAEGFPNVRLAYGRRATELQETDCGVTLTVENELDGRPETVEARFLVGCDGARSWVRREVGLRFEGEGGLDMEFMGGRMVATYFRAPTLLDRLSGRLAWQFWVLLPTLRAVMVTLDGREEFILHAQLAKGVEPEDFDFAAVLSEVCGFETPFEILSQAAWRAGQALVAPRYGRGRIALAGDAVHLFTPTGGLGVNTGIEDAVNLAWKLAGAVAGWGGPGLLSSYERERRPVALRNTSFALQLARAVGGCPIGNDIEADTVAGAQARVAAGRHIEAFARSEFEHPGVQLGARYDGSDLVQPDAPAPEDDPIVYKPTGIPGGRLPHMWISRGQSLLDLVGHGFTLLVLDGSTDGVSRMSGAASNYGIPFQAVVLDRADLRDALGAMRALVRPDQIIAWRSTEAKAPADDQWIAILEVVTGRAASADGPLFGPFLRRASCSSDDRCVVTGEA